MKPAAIRTSPEQEKLAREWLHPYDRPVFARDIRRKLSDRFPNDPKVRLSIATASALYDKENAKTDFSFVPQTREKGTPYAEDHAYPVMDLFLELGEKAGLTDEELALGSQAVVLHDTIENYEKEEERNNSRKVIYQFHGPEVLELVGKGFTKPPKSEFTGTRIERRKAQSAAQLQSIEGFGEPKRLILVLGKFADRLHNIATLRYRPTRTQNRVIRETKKTLMPFFENNLPTEIVQILKDAIEQHNEAKKVFTENGITYEHLRYLARKWYDEDRP